MTQAQAKPNNISITWIELILVILLVLSGMGIWKFAEQQVKTALKSAEPVEETYQRQNLILLHQAELSRSQSELTAVQSQLVELRLQFLRQSSRVAAFQTIYPALQEADSKGKRLAPVGQTTAQEYANSKIELETARVTVVALTSEIERHTERVAEQSTKLAEAQRKATIDYAEAVEQFGWREHLTAVKWASAGIAAFFLVAWGLILVFGTGKAYAISRGVLLIASLLVVYVLIAYDVLGIMGAATLGTLTLVAALIFVSRIGTPQDRPAKTDPAPVENQIQQRQGDG